MHIRHFMLSLLVVGVLLGCRKKNKDNEAPDSPTTQVHQMTAHDDTPPDSVPVQYLIGKVDPAKDETFVPIASQYTQKSGIYMHREAYEAYQKMYDAAKEEGIQLNIVSAMRNFNYQRSIWEAKWTGARHVGGQNLAQTVPDPAERARTILRYSSMPGTSRHHWGTDIDLNALENAYFESGQGAKIYEWLTRHAAEYGFCQPYSPKGSHRPHGYEEEKWHWSYMPVAAKYLDAYRAYVDYGDIKGFKGDEAAAPLTVIDHYVLGINPSCLDWESLQE